MANKFFEMLRRRWDAGARVCIGLDSDPAKLPVGYCLTNGYGNVAAFNTDIVIATKHLALAYKPNVAFYSGRFGAEAQEALHETISAIRQSAPGVPIIFDAKRGDIGPTNVGYVEEAFVNFGADAVTVSHYFGVEAMAPFLNQKDKGIIVLCRTSNPGAGEFQDLLAFKPGEPWSNARPIYQHVAQNVAKSWNYNNNCALVVGATVPEELGEVRGIVGDNMWILVPGYGKQGGDLEAAVRNGISSHKRNIIINESSSVLWASGGPDFAAAARARVLDTTTKMNAILATL